LSCQLKLTVRIVDCMLVNIWISLTICSVIGASFTASMADLDSSSILTSKAVSGAWARVLNVERTRTSTVTVFIIPNPNAAQHDPDMLDKSDSDSFENTEPCSSVSFETFHGIDTNSELDEDG
jgi:hypothetical protein